MTFLLPLGLLGLLTIPLIVVLHLLRERRRRVTVPSLQHWLNLPRRNEGQRLNRLPLTLLLLLHLLAAALLGLAIARPQMLGGVIGRAEQLAIVLDTSTSMGTSDGTSTRFAKAQDRARTLIAGLGAGDQVTVVVAGPTAQVLASGRSADGPTIEAAIAALRPGGTSVDMEGALTLAEASLDPARPGRIVVLTDGSAAPITSRAVAAPVEWQPISGEAPNRAIIAFAARAAGGRTQVYARAANYGDASWSGTLRLFADDQPIDARPLSIAANAESEQTWTLPAGAASLRAEIAGDDALPADDAAVLSVATTRPLNVLLVADEPEPIQRALAAVPGVSVAVVPPAGYADAQAARDGANVTVFDDFLPEQWPDGAALAIYPPASPLLEVRGEQSGVTGQSLSQRGATLDGLGFGGVNFGVVREITEPDWAATLLASENTPLILRGRADGHEVAVWTFDIHDGNLATRLAFPLLVSRTVRDLAPTAPPASLTAGGTLALRPDPRATELLLTSPDGQRQTLPAAPTVSISSLTAPGWYTLAEQGPGGALYETRVAVNAGSPLESDLRAQPAPTFSAAAPGQGASVQRNVTQLWPWLALGALAVLALEWLYTHRPSPRARRATET